jgi:mRNA interferase MazF
MTFRPFDVVVVPFPYSDRLAEKRRPALVVSDEAMEREHGRIWVAMITSTIFPGLGTAPITDLAAAGLPVESVLRASKIATLDADRVVRRAGRLSDDDQISARKALAACAGF